jgi:hypothetical protein
MTCLLRNRLVAGTRLEEGRVGVWAEKVNRPFDDDLVGVRRDLELKVTHNVVMIRLAKAHIGPWLVLYDHCSWLI